MIDLTFIHALEAALDQVISKDFSQDLESRLDAGLAVDGTAPISLKNVCKRAAQRLYFELDGATLLELALLKLASERSGVGMKPTHMEREYSAPQLRKVS